MAGLSVGGSAGSQTECTACQDFMIHLQGSLKENEGLDGVGLQAQLTVFCKLKSNINTDACTFMLLVILLSRCYLHR